MNDQLQAAVETLLNDSTDSRPIEDLKTMLEFLKQDDTAVSMTETPVKFPASSPKNTTQSLRQKLGKNIDDLKDVLCEMMAERVCLDDLLPMTYDEEANEDAMGDHNALTLTNSSLLAAQVYTRLLAFPGAFSSGLVDLHVISELPRILARWRTECAGREWALSAAHKNGGPTLKDKHKQATKRARTMETNDESSGDDDSDMEDERSNSSSPYIIEIADDNALTERQLISRGLELALLVADLPTQKHFASWNKDCRTAIINAVGSSLATTAALFLYSRRQNKNVDVHLDMLSTKLIEKASCALRNWMTTDGSLSVDAAVDIIIDVQRNLYSLIILNESDLPNGEEGELLFYLDTECPCNRVLANRSLRYTRPTFCCTSRVRHFPKPDVISRQLCK
jgi:hypothetical protein